MPQSNSSRARYRPAQLVAGAFAALILIGTLLLMMPISRQGPWAAEPVTALFTATSATCLTGLSVVDTATYWSHFGQVVILLLIQLGGLGIMTLASFAGWIMAGRIGLRGRLNAAAEGRGRDLGEVKSLLLGTIVFTVAVETLIAIALTLRFHFEYGYGFWASIWEGVFHAVSAFNNAGFGLRSNNLVPYVGDEGIILPISTGIILGGLGFPVLMELAIRARCRLRGVRRRMSLTARFTLIGTSILLFGGMLAFLLLEWRGALSALDTDDKVLAAFFHSVSSRTAGFNSIDIGALHPSSLLITDILMFIGAGSGGTAGGVKITTVAVLVSVMIAEIRGDEMVLVAGRRLPGRTIRQALAIIMLSGLTVAGAIMIMQLQFPQFSTHQITFEVISAFATVGLTTGITPEIPAQGQLLLVVLMYAGRVGPITLVAALAARNSRRLYSYPVERPFIG